jgi:hypothetical protein
MYTHHRDEQGCFCGETELQDHKVRLQVSMYACMSQLCVPSLPRARARTSGGYATLSTCPTDASWYLPSDSLTAPTPMTPTATKDHVLCVAAVERPQSAALLTSMKARFW